jgi:transposase
LVLDGAPNHRCRDLAVPDNVSLLFLPPYAPELSPKENLWDEIREKNLQELCPQVHRCRAPQA